MHENSTKSTQSNQILIKSKNINILNSYAERTEPNDEATTSESSKMNHSSSSSSSASSVSLLSNASSSHDVSGSAAAPIPTPTSTTGTIQSKSKFEINPTFMLLVKEEDPFAGSIVRRTLGEKEMDENTSVKNENDDEDDEFNEEDENRNVLVRKVNGHHGDPLTSSLPPANNHDETNSNNNTSGEQSLLSTSVNHVLNNANSPILTNTTLNVIRLFGKYIHMLSIFKIISNQVITYLMQLFQFYFYYIYLDFAHQEVCKQNRLTNIIN